MLVPDRFRTPQQWRDRQSLPAQIRQATHPAEDRWQLMVSIGFDGETGTVAARIWYQDNMLPFDLAPEPRR